MHLKLGNSLNCAMLVLTLLALAEPASAQGSALPADAVLSRPIYLLCRIEGEEPVCAEDPGVQWMEGGVPKPHRVPRPEYPPRLLARGVAGWVLAAFTVTETGAVADAAVLESQPSGLFDAAALRTVRRFKYEPPTMAGPSPCASCMTSKRRSATGTPWGRRSPAH